MIAAPPQPTTKPERPSVNWADRLGRARSPWPYRRRLWIAAAVAIGLHGAVYFSSRESVITAAEFAMGDPAPSLEMDLVAGEEAAEPEVAPEPAPPEPMPEPPTPPEPQPEPPPPDPVPEPEPMPEPEPVKEEMAEPIPEPPKPKPKPLVKSAPKPVAKPAAPKPAAAAPSANAGTPGAAASGAPGGTGRSRGGKSSGAGYLSNPKPPYPPESRAAGEQGLTQLRVNIDATGRPTSVSIFRSSGYSRLDVAAREGVRRWRFKPATRDGQPIATTEVVPLRWTLR